ncbi:hypothetical protein [Desulfovibrio oxyclinae]|uniref:hypothetical protein n=1 Tax=Desulfovibrio oxyclinae TaxID=63560 RepID=UPI000370DD71|nr:hypothetical protein [Desulfovibrio oxyclinae]
MDILTKMALSFELDRVTAEAAENEKTEANLPDVTMAGIFATTFYMGQVSDVPENDIPKLDVSLVSFTWPKRQDDGHYLPTEVDCFKLNMADFFAAVEASPAFRERVTTATTANKLNTEELAMFLEEVVSDA